MPNFNWLLFIAAVVDVYIGLVNGLKGNITTLVICTIILLIIVILSIGYDGYRNTGRWWG